jgi:hypothetical protein
VVDNDNVNDWVVAGKGLIYYSKILNGALTGLAISAFCLHPVAFQYVWRMKEYSVQQ